MRTNHKEQGADVRPSPSGLAEALKLSVDRDVAQRVIDPQSDEDVHEVAHWASESRYFEPEIRAWATLEPHQSVSFNLTKSWLRDRVSPHPERFREVVETCQILQLRFLKAQTERLESCGKVWWSQYVVRVFWRDWRGRERLRRQIGVHRCKHAWCPVCSRTRQAKLSQEIEKCLILASDLGLHDGHARLVTLTIPNGKDIYELIEQAHTAFAKLQRTRWWNRQVFGWVRGSEIVTGRDGNWNVHIHLLVLFWSQWVSYATLSEKWTEELGGPRGNGRKYIVDCETLCALQSKRKKGGPRPLKRKNSIARAARYITKYLSKPEELRSLCSGPGGLAHLVSATKGLRRFSVGAGCSVLRKAAHVLLPNRIYQAEEALAETYLHQGRPPCRVEYLDPNTGEVTEGSPTRLMDHRQQALAAWGECLETNPIPKMGQRLPGRVIGVPVGFNGRYRCLGPLPLAGRGSTVSDFRHRGRDALSPFQSLVAKGDWRVYSWEEQSTNTGRVRRYSAVLPGVRYPWKFVRNAMVQELARSHGGWAQLRREANRAGAVHLIGPMDTLGFLREASKTLGNLEKRDEAETLSSLHSNPHCHMSEGS